jgi:hypothetical protein
MKKLGMILTLVGGLWLMAACSSDNTPTGVVEKALKGLISGDVRAYTSKMIFEEDAEPEKEKEAQEDFAKMMERELAKQEEKEKVTDFEIIKEELSKTGTYARVTYKDVLADGKEAEHSIYLIKDKEGAWRILLFGSDKMLDE